MARQLDRLSDREKAVLERLAAGRRAQSTAEEFAVSLATVRTQIRAVLRKLEVSSQLEAAVLGKLVLAGEELVLRSLSRWRASELYEVDGRVG